MGGEERWAWYEFPTAHPRPVSGGIKARSPRGAFASTWWGRRWIDVLEGFGWKSRLQRGRSYARRGQVVDFRLRKGYVEAKVQGSRSQPYQVRIQLSVLPSSGWSRVMQGLSQRAAFTAELLSGEMPKTIEDVFRKARVPLFPARDDEFRTECNCPDWANPCKHIAALHYILGEAFDRDPFLLFALRGKPREEFLADLRASRAGLPLPRSRSEAAGGAKGRETGMGIPSPSEPVPQEGNPVPLRGPSESPFADASSFWGPSTPTARPAPSAATPPGSDSPRPSHTLLRALGTPAVLRGREDLSRQLEGAYDVVSARAQSVLRPTPPSPRKRPTARHGRSLVS